MSTAESEYSNKATLASGEKKKSSYLVPGFNAWCVYGSRDMSYLSNRLSTRAVTKTRRLIYLFILG